jgi:hypothetical protein
MADITMCNAKKLFTHAVCPMKDTCYRNTATPSEFRQAYFIAAPFIDKPEGASCEYFWKTEDTK